MNLTDILIELNVIPSNKIIYARKIDKKGNHIAIVRGRGTRNQEVKDFLKSNGFKYKYRAHGYFNQLNKDEFLNILKKLNRMHYQIHPKDKLHKKFIY